MSDCCGGCGLQRPYINGKDGKNGLNNYELAIQSGEFTGTLAEYLASLHGEDGKSAYELWLAHGNTGSEADFIASLAGTNGANGTDGAPAFTFTTASFVQPAIGSSVVVQVQQPHAIVASGTPVQVGNDVSLTANNWYISAGVLFNSIILVNPGPSQGYPTGIATNVAPGTTIATGMKVCPRGLDGKDGADGNDGGIGPVGPTGPPVEVYASIPPTPGAGGAHTAIVTNAPATPGIAMLYAWNGVAWAPQAQLTGVPGSQIAFMSGDPNTAGPGFMAKGDVVWDDSVAGTFKIWQKNASNTWDLKGTLTGAATSLGSLYRVGIGTDQPIVKGGTTPAVVQFEKQSPAPLFNGGAWTGNKFTAPVTIATDVVFRLENMKVITDTAGDTVDFTFHIRLNGVNQATGTIAITSSDTEGKLALLTWTASGGLTSGDVVDVRVTPSTGTTNQWYMHDNGTAFYNQV